ncbi:MAG: S1C family serine protease [Mesorhizobium sp.]|nr:S1C family serine protease [Mesorhizobium sp.]
MTPLETFSDAISDIVEHAAPALASISGRHRPTASAFHWRDGLFIAADEAISGDEDVTLTFADGAQSAAEIVGRDASTGIALLKPATPPSAMPSLPAARNSVRAGALAIAVGRGDASVLAAFGAVSLAGPAWRSMRGGAIDRRLELSLSVGLRFEGAAVLDASGGLIGMLLFGPRRKVLVIPAETIARVAETLADKGYVPRGYLGAGLHPLRHAGGKGAIVLSVEENGPAHRAGLLTGDVITTWEGDEVSGVRDLLRRLGPDSVGATVTLGIVRAGAARDVSLTVGARPHG